jgi:hypothetical protein
MRPEKETEVGLKSKTKKRIIHLVLVLLAVFILSVVFLVPAFVSSAKGRKIILAKINRSVDGRADFADLSMSWWKGVRISDFRFNGSAEEILVKIKQIVTKPHYGSILMGDLSFGKTKIREPQVEINLEKWRPKRAERPEQKVSESKKRKPVTLPINKIDMTVTDGSLRVTDAKAKTVELSHISSKVDLRPLGQGTTFNIIATVADKAKESKISAQGKVRPKKKTGWNFKGTSGDFTVEVNDLDLASLGPILALGGIDIKAQGKVSANLTSEVKDGRIADLSGTIKGKDLDVSGGQLKGDQFKTSALNVGVKLSSAKEVINVDKLDVHSDWLDAEASGVVPKTFKSLSEFVKPDSAYALKGRFQCDLAQALSQMPRTFRLKEGMKVTSGRLSGDIETSAKAGRKEISGQGSIVGLAGVVDGKTITLSQPVKAIVEITSDKSGIKYDKLDVSAAFCDISCAGTGELLRYSADVDLAKLQSELGQFVNIGEYRMAGELFSKGQLSSSRDKITAVGSSVVKDLRLSSAKGLSAFEPKANMDFSVTADRSKHIVDVNFINATATLGKVGIKNSVLPLGKKAQKSLELAVSANDVDLEKLQPFAVLLGSFPKEMKLAGIAKSDISISSKKGVCRIVTESTKVKNLKVLYPKQEPFEQEQVLVVFDAEVNPAEKSIAVKELQLISPRIKIRKGNLSKTTKAGKTKIKGQVDCEYEWSAVTTVAGPFLPKGLKLKGKREQTIGFSSEYPAGKKEELLANLSTKGKLGFDSAYYKGLGFSPTEAEIRFVKGLFTISQFSSKVNNGVFRFAGEADFGRKPTLFITPGPIHIAEGVQLNDDVSKELLIYINPIFADAVNVSGVGNLNCQRLALPLRGASGKDAEIVGAMWADNMRLSASNLLSELLSVAGLKLRDQKIRVHKTNFVLKDGFLRYDDMQVDVGDNPLNFKGVIGLDKSLDMIVMLPYTLDGRTVRVGEEEVAERISIPLKGTIDNPELDLGKLLELQLKQRLEDQLKGKIFEGLEGLLK